MKPKSQTTEKLSFIAHYILESWSCKKLNYNHRQTSYYKFIANDQLFQELVWVMEAFVWFMEASKGALGRHGQETMEELIL